MKTVIAPMLAIILGAISASASRAQEGLVLELTVPSESVVLGTLAVVRAALTNTAALPQAVPRDLGPEYMFVRYAIGQNPEELVPLTPVTVKEEAEPLVMLPEGGVIENDVPVYYDGARWTMPEPGVYFVRAYMGEDIVSNLARFEVIPPRSVAEAACANGIISTPAAARFAYLRGGEHLRDAAESVFQSCIDTVPESPLADHARASIGESLLRPAADFQASAIRDADPERALALLADVGDVSLGIDRSVTAALGQAEALRMLNDTAGAARLQENIPNLIRRDFGSTFVVPDLSGITRDFNLQMEFR